MDDDWLVQQCLDGRRTYWVALIRRYQPDLFKHISGLLETPEDAWDVVRETFRRAETQLAEFKDHADEFHPLSELAESHPPFFRWLSRFAAEPYIKKLSKESSTSDLPESDI